MNARYESRERHYAQQILCHYFSLIAERAGIKWDYDNDHEVNGVVDSIIEAVKDELRHELPKVGDAS